MDEHAAREAPATSRMSSGATRRGASETRERGNLRAWKEILLVVGIYLVYSTVRNRFGSAGGPAGHANGIAYGHALDVIQFERTIGLYVERTLQDWYLGLPAHGLIQVWNVFYGTAHFVITAAALVWLFVRDPSRYPRMRNTLALTTLLALIGFAAFSLMPPRLIDKSPDDFGPPAAAQVDHTGFVDTLDEFPTFWSFDSGGLRKISNQYAAMPSLHIGWATWSALVLFPLVRRRWARILVASYPFVTLFCIVVTANHFWLDAAAGLATLAGGYVIAGRIAAWFDQRRLRAAT
jgi:hypothetical protein